MSIWAHTMFKNEARWLWYSVTSIVDFVDKILLWNTGSTDGSWEIAKTLKNKYPGKITLNEVVQKDKEDFPRVRQMMLEATKSDWFIVLDGDEVWWQDSIRNLVSVIKDDGTEIESVVVPTVNLVGDIYHFQGPDAGRYTFGDKTGHYNLRAIKKSIPGLHSQGVHGVWGWADGENKMIQDRNTYKIIDAPYLHATNLPRSSKDAEVIKRAKKLKYEIGIEFPKDYFYPEAFFKPRPGFVDSPWRVMNAAFRSRAIIETPFRKIKRKVWSGRVGY